jgi:hypothetical protein
MCKNIECFIQFMGDKINETYKIYDMLIKENLIESPLIYTDNYKLCIDKNIPVFSTYYIRHHFYKNFLLLDVKDLKYIPNQIKNRCIILYDDSCEINNIPVSECLLALSYNDNIKDKIDETIRQIK